MLSNDGRRVLCDVRECGQKAVGGCELRIEAGHGGDHVTIPGDLVAWCEVLEQSILEKIADEYIALDVEQLKAGYLARSNIRGRAM